MVKAVRKTAFPQGDKAMTSVFVSKLQRSLFTGVLAMGVFASASHAVAQEAAIVTVPFAFQNGAQHLPAGTYRIDMKPGHVMLLRGTGPHSSGFAMIAPEERLKAPETGKVVFRRYGNHAYLRELWIAGETTGYRCFTSKAEKYDQEQLQTARTTTVPTNVEVALNTAR
jgi:hypothetical protein